MTDEKLLTTAETISKLGVSRWTLRQWDKQGYLTAVRTKGGHRRYRLSDINAMIGTEQATEVRKDSVACYCRVSSHDQKQKGDLDRQKARVLEYCIQKKYNVEHILVEVASGMSDSRPKLQRLFQLVSNKEINRLVVEHKDRLTRFNYGFLEAFFKSHGVTIELIEEVLPKSYESELVEDMISLMSSFSAKLYGRRSAERRKQKHLKVVGGTDL